MPDQDYNEFERDEELLEARRLKRLELKRKRKIQQRIIIGVVALALIFVIVLIARGCSAKPEEETKPPVEEEQKEEIVVPKVDPDVTATLSAVGDIMVYDAQLDDAKLEDGTYDFSPSFNAIKAYTIGSDLTVGNLELNFTGSEPYRGTPYESPYFNSPDSLAATLADIGFDILQTANTFSIANGINGLQSTIDVLNRAGIDHVGTHASDPAASGSGGVVIRDVNGIKIAFIGFTKGLNNWSLPGNHPYAVDLLYTDYVGNYKQVDTTGILARIDAAKKHNPDVIVAMVHWGSEYDAAVSASQEEIAELMCKNGVDVILGSHSHIVGPMKTIQVETTDGEKKECFIAYSLGNFYTSKFLDYTQESLILNLEFTKSGVTGDTTITKINYTPVYILDHGEGADLRYEVLPIRAAIQSSMFQEHEDVMNAAIASIKEHSQSDYDAQN